jgi:predicted permease
MDPSALVLARPSQRLDPMSAFSRDLRFAARMLVKNPGLTAVAVLALGLAMGVNSSVFSAVDTFLMRPMPVSHPERLAAVFAGPRGEPRVWNPISYPDYLAMRAETRVFSGLVASTTDDGSISDGTRAPGTGQRATTAFWELVTGNAFDELGVRAQLGRVLTAESDSPATAPMAVISDRLWRLRFAADPGVIGRTIYLDTHPFTIVGVMPARFKGIEDGLQPGSVDLWIPLAIRGGMYRGTDDTFLTDRARRSLFVIGHLQPGVTHAQAEARLGALAQVLGQQYPATNAGIRFAVTSEVEGRYRQQFGAVKLGFALALFTAGLVLLISCANVANLLLSRASKRTKEIGIRVALGAGRGRIVRQLLTESVLLALLGGALGLVAAHWFGDLLHAFLPPMPLRLDFDLQADWRILAWAFGAALVAGIAFGAAPAWRAARADVVTALKTDVGAEGQRRRGGLRQVLVIAQLAISIVVLASGGLLLRSLRQIERIDPGFRTDNLLTALINPSLFSDDVGKQHQLFAELRRRLLRRPGVVAVSSSRYMPLVNVAGSAGPVVAEGQPPPPPNQSPPVHYSVTYAGYFQVAGTDVLLGRDFHDEEHEGAPRTVIINRELARRLFGRPEEALGRRLRVGPAQAPLLRIVGITRDGRSNDLIEEPQPWLFFPESPPWLLDTNEGMRTLLIRAADRGQLPAVAEALRDEVQALDPRLPVEDLRIGDGHLVFALYAPRLAAELGVILGLLALALATMGIYSVMTYAVSQRTKEIGIRMALGGQAGDVLRLVLRQALVLVAIGVAVGALGALAVARLLASFLYGVSAADPLTFAAAILLLAAVALVATLLPARRATRVDPMIALRHS